MLPKNPQETGSCGFLENTAIFSSYRSKNEALASVFVALGEFCYGISSGS